MKASTDWRRIAAVLLLLWAVADITMPGLCVDDDDVCGATSASDGDCWCCCYHVAPTASLELRVSLEVQPSPEILEPHSFVGWKPATYHPPRSEHYSA